MISFILSLINFIKYLRLKNKENLIFLYSESKFYRYHFLDLINELKKNNNNIFIFITSDYDDYLFHKKIIKSIYIHYGFLLHLFFKILKCKCMIMTLTDLGNHLNKSNFCKNYIYFFHSLSSTFKKYTKEAFQNYDIIFTNGEYQKKELLELEKIYKLPKKKYVNIGYFYLDYISRNLNLNLTNKKTILFAPSWNYNKNNILNDFGLKIIEVLIGSGYQTILRPHPEQFKRSKKIINKIKKVYKNHDLFFLDNNPSNLDSLEKSDILITDNSAIDMEFGILFSRPIIYINYKDKIHNPEFFKIDLDNIDEKFKNNIGYQIETKRINELPLIVSNLISNNKDTKFQVEEFKKKNISNLGCSSMKASEFITSNFIDK